MDKIIEKISVIEHDSVKILEDARAKKQEIAAQIQEETKQFDSSLEAETKRRIKELEASMKQEVDDKLAKQKADAENALKRLEQHYRQYEETYVERLFKEMTEV